jgi:hypothetical protein
METSDTIVRKCDKCGGSGTLTLPVKKELEIFYCEYLAPTGTLVRLVNSENVSSKDKMEEAGRNLARWLYTYSPGTFVKGLLNEYEILREEPNAGENTNRRG